MTQTNDKIYELLNNVRLELKKDIARQGEDLGKQIGQIDKKLDKRVESIEKDVNKLKIESATGNVKLGILIFISSSIISAIITVIASKVSI